MRYVIKHPTLGYFDEMKPAGSRDVTLNGAVIATEILYTPSFKAFIPNLASHYYTQEDAQKVISSNPTQYGGTEAFLGCVVEETET